MHQSRMWEEMHRIIGPERETLGWRRGNKDVGDGMQFDREIGITPYVATLKIYSFPKNDGKPFRSEKLFSFTIPHMEVRAIYRLFSQLLIYSSDSHPLVTHIAGFYFLQNHTLIVSGNAYINISFLVYFMFLPIRMQAPRGTEMLTAVILVPYTVSGV